MTKRGGRRVFFSPESNWRIEIKDDDFKNLLLGQLQNSFFKAKRGEGNIFSGILLTNWN